ncbi:MAG: ATP phosphoribosyltransferase, partial [Bacteroidota bacterium]
MGLVGKLVVDRDAEGRSGRDEVVALRLQRLDGVMQVDESKYIMLHAPRSALGEITSLLPGSETPTVMPLNGEK